AGREDLAEQATDELRTIGLVDVQQRLQELERTEHYAAALEVIREKSDTYARLRDWGPDIERITRAGQTLADYQRASGALQAGDKETAMKLLGGVVAVDAAYKDAAKLL